MSDETRLATSQPKRGRTPRWVGRMIETFGSTSDQAHQAVKDAWNRRAFRRSFRFKGPRITRLTQDPKDNRKACRLLRRARVWWQD